jgi:transposase
MAKAAAVVLSTEERAVLESWARSGKTERRMAERARIVLRLADGQRGVSVAREMKTRPARVCKWRRRFAVDRLKGLSDAPRSGKPRRYDARTERRILKALDETPPKGYGIWTGTLLARHLGDVTPDRVWQVLRFHRIHLQRRRTWCISTDPEFARKAADIVGLYLDPPENALVLCVDEKPHIQALERAQGWLRLPNGKALTGYNHEYTRHGTTTLFAALEVATGLVKTGHFQRRRRREFLQFMNEVVAEHPNEEIHVVLDNLNTHKPKQDRWLARHKNVHFHYTPTHASWLNQIEIWFSLLTRFALRPQSFTHPRQVRQAIDAYTEVSNEHATPFEWTKRYVAQKPLRHKYSNLHN